MTESQTRQRVRDAAAAIGIKHNDESLALQVKNIAIESFKDWQAFEPTVGGRFGLEDLGAGLPVRNAQFNVGEADASVLVNKLQKLKMAPRHILQAAQESLNILDGDRYNPREILRDGHQADGANSVGMSAIVGRTAAAALEKSSSFATEAFGEDVNRLAIDDRLTMSLIIMRPWENIMDKGLARVNDSSPVVTIKIPKPEAYDWAATQGPNTTSSQRNGSSNTYRLRDLYRNPTPVNAAPKKIIPLAANDAKAQIWGSNATTSFYKTNQSISTLDLSRTSALTTYANVDRTDLVSDGGSVDNIIIGVTNPNSGGTAYTDYFSLPTRAFSMAAFVPSPNTNVSGQRQVMMKAIVPITNTTKKWDGTTSQIAALLTDAKIKAEVSLNAVLNIQTGVLEASGTVTMTLVPLAGSSAPSSATTNTFGTLTSSLVAYSVDTYFDEENMRKTNLAVWVNYAQVQFVVPRSRTYFTEYSLAQDVDENAIAATSSIMALGNGRRGLDIIVNSLADIAQGMTFAAANPEIVGSNQLDEQSLAQSLVKPTVITTTLNYQTEELNTMNESTRLTEMHGKFRARFLEMVAMLFAKSLMLNQYKGGETPVMKAWVHSSIADIIIGILDYHPDLQDRATTATGADFSMTLPNGYRLDVIKTNLDCMQNRLYAVPVIESDMTSILSAASIRDCGTVTVNYQPTINGAASRRITTTTREIVMMSNRVGICMNITGLTAQLGPMGYDPITLNADYSDSIAA
jgi:hypothetical protein